MQQLSLIAKLTSLPHETGKNALMVCDFDG